MKKVINRLLAIFLCVMMVGLGFPSVTYAYTGEQPVDITDEEASSVMDETAPEEIEEITQQHEDEMLGTEEVEGFSIQFSDYYYDDIKYTVTGRTHIPLSEILEALECDTEIDRVYQCNGTEIDKDETGEWFIDITDAGLIGTGGSEISIIFKNNESYTISAKVLSFSSDDGGLLIQRDYQLR